MTYTNHRQAHVSAEVARIFDFIHRGHAAERAVGRIISDTPTTSGSLRVPRAGGRPAAASLPGSLGEPGAASATSAPGNATRRKSRGRRP